MNKRFVLTAIGVVLMAAGTVAVGRDHLEKEREVTTRLAQAAREREEVQQLMSEEQKRVEEERALLDKMKGELEEEKRRWRETERQLRAELERREQQAAARRQESESPPAPRTAEKPKSAEAPKRAQAAAPRKSEDNKPEDKTVPSEREASKRTAPTGGGWQVSVGGEMPVTLPGRHNVDGIVHRAAEEAAASHGSVVFTNTQTGDRVRADPAGYNRMGMRIRIRTWEKGQLVSDEYERFPRFRADGVY